MRATVGNCRGGGTAFIRDKILSNAHKVSRGGLEGDTGSVRNLQAIASPWIAPALTHLQLGGYHSLEQMSGYPSPPPAAAKACDALQRPGPFAQPYNRVPPATLAHHRPPTIASTRNMGALRGISASRPRTTRLHPPPQRLRRGTWRRHKENLQHPAGSPVSSGTAGHSATTLRSCGKFERPNMQRLK